MIKKIATDISSMLNNFTPSNDFDGLVGMKAHFEKMEPLLCLGSDEVRMIGIWGPPGIGKTTIGRVAYNQLSNSFQLSDDLKSNYSRLYGFEELARKVTRLSGELPLGLRVMGSYFQGMSKQEWINSLPRLRTSIDADIRSILKFSYDALDDEDKYLFLHIACFFSSKEICKVEEHLAKNFLEPLRSLKWMDLSESVNLKELPDLSTATNLEKLNLYGCSSLIKLLSLPGNSLEELDIGGCSSLVEFPSFIGNAVNLRELDLCNCSRV
ncbi:hypothetical protein DY000_02000470 [Brassica cretica]|uniref:NB-ARC domain-containing protein n=1 Tax=Brassica cretica TaxID=69181 RepID=A0ABQ7CCX7_BRACR|nr:hypothetical protein DY000_02000470 [Brassica cretica]